MLQKVISIAALAVAMFACGIVIGRHGAQPQKIVIFQHSERSAGEKSVAGVYEFEKYGVVRGVDLRSDGTAVAYSRDKRSSFKYGEQNIKWTPAGETISINHKSWKREGYDLIDDAGNRWIRESF